MKGYVARKRDCYYAVIYEGLDPVTGRDDPGSGGELWLQCGERSPKTTDAASADDRITSRGTRQILPTAQAAVSLPRWMGTRRPSSSNAATSSWRAPRASRYWRRVETRTSFECSSLKMGPLGDVQATSKLGLAHSFGAT